MSPFTASTTSGPIECEVLWSEGGLVVHRPPATPEGERHWRDYGYTVAHERSGLAVVWCITAKKRAIDIARTLLAAGDWDRDRETFMDDTAMKAAVKTAREALT